MAIAKEDVASGNNAGSGRIEHTLLTTVVGSEDVLSSDITSARKRKREDEWQPTPSDDFIRRARKRRRP